MGREGKEGGKEGKAESSNTCQPVPHYHSSRVSTGEGTRPSHKGTGDKKTHLWSASRVCIQSASNTIQYIQCSSELMISSYTALVHCALRCTLLQYYRVQQSECLANSAMVRLTSFIYQLSINNIIYHYTSSVVLLRCI